MVRKVQCRQTKAMRVMKIVDKQHLGLKTGRFAVDFKAFPCVSGPAGPENASKSMENGARRKALSGGYPLKLIMEEIDKLKSLDHPAVLRLFEPRGPFKHENGLEQLQYALEKVVSHRFS